MLSLLSYQYGAFSIHKSITETRRQSVLQYTKQDFKVTENSRKYWLYKESVIKRRHTDLRKSHRQHGERKSAKDSRKK